MISLSKEQKDDFFKRAMLGADWFVNSQLGQHRSEWNSDFGRYLYYYCIPEKKYVEGISWTSGRALFTLAEAYKITNDKKYLDSALTGAKYVEALQVMDPEFTSRGTIKEFTPQSEYSGVLDGAQAASGLIMLGGAANNKFLLRRGEAFCDFLIRHFKPEIGMPSRVWYYPEEKVEYLTGYGDNACGQCAAIPLMHMYNINKNKAYLPIIKWSADYILDCQKSDGAFNYIKDIKGQEAPEINHHWGHGEGDDRFIFQNDDGIMTLVLGAYKITKDQRYLDSAVAYAEWMCKTDVAERPFCAFPVKANNVLDISKISGKDFTPWVMDNLDEHLLKLQVLDGDDKMALGAFRGEDEEGEGGIFGHKSLDYVNTRNTCYSIGTLLRLSGKGTGSGFSPFGLNLE